MKMWNYKITKLLTALLPRFPTITREHACSNEATAADSLTTTVVMKRYNSQISVMTKFTGKREQVQAKREHFGYGITGINSFM